MRKNNIIEILVSDKVIAAMKCLYPKWELQHRLRKYYELKIRYFLYIIGLGTLMAVMIYFSENRDSEKETLRRNEYLGGDKSVPLMYEIEESDISSELMVDVSEKQYPKELINSMTESFKEELINQILGENKSQDEVRNDLVFKEKLDNYPFSIRYRSDDPVLISRTGKINRDRLFELLESENKNSQYEESENIENNEHQENLESGIKVRITATASYKDYEEETVFYINVLRPVLTEKERYDKSLESVIKENDKETVESDYLYLPKEIEGKRIRFYEKKSNSEVIIFVVFSVAALAVYFGKDHDLEKEIEKRNKELEYEYPTFIGKFTLFYNAGMPVKSIWMKMCSDYEKENESGNRKKFLYEEMIITKAKMLDGTQELEAYEEFAKRINLPKYRLFISLIEQSVTKGKRDLSIELKKEADNAFTERKNNARKLLEEASTKLLIPMFMMLIVVMVIVIFPAFMSFSK